jgi:hypothetical protein
MKWKMIFIGKTDYEFHISFNRINKSQTNMESIKIFNKEMYNCWYHWEESLLFMDFSDIYMDHKFCISFQSTVL